MSVFPKYCVDSSLVPLICVNFHCFHCTICFPPSSAEKSWQLHWPHLLQHFTLIFHLFDDSHSNGCAMTYICCKISFAIFGLFYSLVQLLTPYQMCSLRTFPRLRSSLHPCLLSCLCRRFSVGVLLAHICFCSPCFCSHIPHSLPRSVDSLALLQMLLYCSQLYLFIVCSHVHVCVCNNLHM